MSTPQFTQEDIDNAINQAVQRSLEAQADQHAQAMRAQADQHAQAMDELRSALTRGPAVVTMVAEHAGGIGTKIAPTWSLYDQTLAARGEHPLQQQG